MANKPIQTILNNKQKELFNQFRGEKSTYQALRDLVDTIPQFNQEEKEIIVEKVEEELKQDELSKLLNELKG
tara:strand:- start:181 stop:396 length:216 start_codon:yes stop_codon:yes gene_type:complete